MKLTRAIAIAGFVASALTVAVTVAVVQLGTHADEAVDEAFEISAHNAVLTRQLLTLSYEIKLDVGQVQQGLTDVSATRGLDGFDDGFDQAKAFAAKLDRDVKAARELVAGTEYARLDEALAGVAAPFERYYAQGVAMANAYVEKGPEGGNALMADFDATATEISKAVDDMLRLVDELTQANFIQSNSLREAASAQEHQRTYIDIAGHGVNILAMLAMTVFGVFTIGRLTKTAATAREIADGNLDAPALGQSRWDELSMLFKAIGVFRDNGRRLQKLAAQEEDQLAQRQAERAAMMQSLQEGFGDVVEAAVAGDFSKRVDANFPDAELNRLAASVNELVGTVERGLTESGQVLAALARTDLTQRVEGQYEGAFKQLKMDTNAVADTLGGIVVQLRDTSRGVKTATGEILAGANDLSDRTTKQAGTIEETSAAMEQIAVTVADNSKKAEEAFGNTNGVSKAAQDGRDVMQQANQAMERITQSSDQISKIIGLIDDIAFQTNLLALNASVEAARAGEAGKGFAVVAVEVRRLAQSAAEASNDIKQLIEKSAGEVKSGSSLVLEATNRLEAMLDSIKANAVLMEGIARASREQASSIDEVNVAIRQLDEMTQHNAALVEQTNAAIAQTEAQAVELDRIIDVFRIDTNQAQRDAEHDSRPGEKEQQATGVRGMQDKLASVAKSYLSGGATARKVAPAADSEWDEF